MSLAHLTLPTRHVEKTVAFFEETLGYARRPAPGNSPVDALWLDIGRGQQIHVVHVDPLDAPRSEGEFGRHIAVFHPRPDFSELKERLVSRGAELMAPLRDTPFERFFFRDPVNGYVFEVIEEPPDLVETGDERRAPARLA
jgi:catechol 2,3-dioxygenase-like lactoylglutathione lyase family enzyme